MPAILTYFDNDGLQWRVRDGIVQDGRFKPLQLGDHYARFRVFSCKKPRRRRVYRFHPSEQHAVNEPALDTQFIAALEVRS